MKTRLQGGKWPFKAPLGYINGRDSLEIKRYSRTQIVLRLYLRRFRYLPRLFTRKSRYGRR